MKKIDEMIATIERVPVQSDAWNGIAKATLIFLLKGERDFENRVQIAALHLLAEINGIKTQEELDAFFERKAKEIEGT